MSGPEQRGLASFLFDRTGIEVLDIKFLKGRGHDLTDEELCAVSQRILSNFFVDSKSSKLPEGRSVQRSVAEILESQ
jgi:hypothetical protein